MLYTGIHLMRTGEIVADLRRLATLPYVSDLIAAKTEGERAAMNSRLVASERLAADVRDLTQELHEARDASTLPPRANAHDALHDLVVRARLEPA